MCKIFTTPPPFLGRKSGKFNRIAALLFVSASAISFAQEGKVGINTESPRATMEITPTKKNNEDTATSNEGLIIPQLSKTRVANIDDQKLVKGTLIYVKETISYTGTNPKVANIDASGFYHYNGTQWEKGVGGANTNTTPAENIYTSDGTLSGTRTIDMNRNNLIFNGHGKIGINTDNPKADLDIIGTLRTFLPNGETSDNVVVAGDDGMLKKIDANTFRSSLGVNAELLGFFTTENSTLVCNKDNIGDIYLLPGGRLGCNYADPNGPLEADKPYWFYRGTLHFVYTNCNPKSLTAAIVFDGDEKITIEKGTPFVVSGMVAKAPPTKSKPTHIPNLTLKCMANFLGTNLTQPHNTKVYFNVYDAVKLKR